VSLNVGADPPQRPSRTRSNPFPGASTNGPSLKADDVILVESKDYKESRNKQTLPYGTYVHCDVLLTFCEMYMYLS